MKHLFIGSAILTAVSGLVSLFLFLNPMPETFLPHWAIPLFSAGCLLILIGAQRGPDPKHPERGFWAILVGLPILGLIFQLHYLAPSVDFLSIFQSKLVPIMGLHFFLAIVGNYVTTSKSMLSGFPTPWNLRSDLSWRKSHRLAGFGLVLLAIVSGITTLVSGQFQEEVLGGGMLMLGLLFIAYSRWVWHRDPNRLALWGHN